MNTLWNLDNIYTGVNSREFKEDLVGLKVLLEEFVLWSDKNLAEFKESEAALNLEKFIVFKNRIMAYEKLRLYLSLASSTDTSDEELAKALDAVENIFSKTAYCDALFSAYIKHIKDMDKYIEESAVLYEHRFFLYEEKQRADHRLSPDLEAVISDMKLTGSYLWEKLWQQLSSALAVDFDNKELTLSEVRNLAYSSDADVRKSAYEAELKAYDKIKEPAAFCMNGIKGEVIKTSSLRKYLSPLDMTLEHSRMDRSILEAMLSAIEETLPKLRKYFIIKSKKLGNSGALPFYDLVAPVGGSRKYTVEEARDFVIRCFHSFSRELGDFAAKVFAERWIDLMPRKGKVGGAYCETIHSLKESRILINFGGTFDDVITIAHETGHAFHNTRLFSLSEINGFYPMPIAETASTFCESIVINEALKTASGKEREGVLELDLQGVTQCIIDIYSRFLFEDSVFERRKEGVLSSAELSSLMLEAQKKAYGNGLDCNYLHPYMWVCKPHYYDAKFNYYNFPYAFGVLLSKGLYAMYKDMGDSFVPLYDKILAASSTNSLKDIGLVAGIDLTQKDFWIKGLNAVEEEIDEFEK